MVSGVSYGSGANGCLGNGGDDDGDGDSGVL